MSVIDTPTTSGKVRLSLDLAPEVNSYIETQAQELGITKSEILRKAIALLKVARDASHQQQSLGVIGEDKKLVHEIIGL